MHLEQGLRTVLSSEIRLRNIFKAPKVAGHFCSSHHIPPKILSKISQEIIKIIKFYAGKKNSYKVLEAGMGAGRFTAPFAIELNKSCPGSILYGLDNSKAMLREAKKNIPKVDFIEYKLHDITSSLRYPKNYFDVSISFYVYHCINNWRKALNNVIKVVASPKLMIFLREHSQWGYHLDCRFDGIRITDKDYCNFWKEYFKLRQAISPLPTVEISASNIDQLMVYLKTKGFKHIHKMVNTKWKRDIVYKEALESIELGLFTKLRVGLDRKQRSILRNEMGKWLDRNRINTELLSGKIPASLEVDIFYREGEI